MNLTICKGNLGGDPVIKTSNEVTYARFSLAVDRPGPDGERATDWYSVVSFRKLAETMKCLSKGDQVLVTGSLKRKEFTRGGVEHHDVEIIARDIEFLRVKAWAADSSDPGDPSDSPGPGYTSADPSDASGAEPGSQEAAPSAGRRRRSISTGSPETPAAA
jgi:single stranded DNA-binding protein